MSTGWIKLHRQIQDCCIWQTNEPFDKRSAWIDLLLSAYHRDKKIIFNGEPVVIKRGQYLTSIRKLSAKWNWSVNKTYRFIKLLESEKMLQRESDKGRTLITIENYGVYQDSENTNEHTYGNTNENTDGNTDEHRDKTVIETLTEHKQEYKNNKECKKERKEEDIIKNTTYSSGESIEIVPPNTVISMTLNDKSLYHVSQNDVNEWMSLYPAVDVMQELRNMKGWCDANPSKRKTRRGIKRFINSWLSKKQDKSRIAYGGNTYNQAESNWINKWRDA